MNSIKEIGKLIRERRKNLKLEIEDLKDYSDITCSTISNIENGKANPTIKTLQKILEPLGLEIKINIKREIGDFMQKGKVYRNKIFAGLLIKISNKEYIFQYDKDYLEKDNAKAISLNFPLQEKEFKSNHMFAFFFNMLAEGSMKDLQCKQLKIDKEDNFSRLLKTTNMNTIGSITLEEIINE